MEIKIGWLPWLELRGQKDAIDVLELDDPARDRLIDKLRAQYDAEKYTVKPPEAAPFQAAPHATAPRPLGTLPTTPKRTAEERDREHLRRFGTPAVFDF